MSSRNVYLNPEERQAATVLFRSLSLASQAYADGERQAENLRQLVQQIIAEEPLAKLQYFSCANPLTLQEILGEIQGDGFAFYGSIYRKDPPDRQQDHRRITRRKFYVADYRYWQYQCYIGLIRAR